MTLVLQHVRLTSLQLSAQENRARGHDLLENNSPAIAIEPVSKFLFSPRETWFPDPPVNDGRSPK